MHLHRFTFYLLIFSILFVSVEAFISVWKSHYTFGLYSMNMLAPAISFMVLVFVIRKQIGTSKRFWVIIAIGVACEWIAQTIWGSYEWVWSMEAPEIGIADLFWYSNSFLYLIALYVRLKNSGERTRHLLDSAILLISISVISWGYLVKPAYYGNDDLDFFTLGVDLFYPVTSVLRFFILVVWLLNGERRFNSKTLLFLMGGFVCYVFGDLLYVFLIDVHHMDSLATWIDPFWASASFCLALAGLYSLNPASRPILTGDTRSVRILRFSVPYIGLLLFVGLFSAGQPLNSIFLAGITSIVVLIFVRQVMFLLDREKLLEQLKHALERSEYLASYDSLTGLLNRRTFEQELTIMLSSAAVRQEQVAVLFFDLDKFKIVNDLYGHHTGDLLLQAVAEHMTLLQHEGMRCARFGGDEFVISITTPSEWIGRLDEITGIIIQGIPQRFELEGNVIYTSLSVGIAVFPDHALNVTDLIKRADQNMYLAKRGASFSL